MSITAARTLAQVLSLAIIALAAGCRGSSSPPTPTPRTGVFVDAPVANLGYRTASRSGRTDASGSFKYLDGESVTFFIGAIETPPVPAGAVVSPMAVFGAQDLASDPGAVNLARLLLTLDTDGDPSNGITLSDAAHAAATTAVDFSSAAFDAVVAGLVAAGGGSPTLVTATDAVDHLAQGFPIVGGWTMGTPGAPVAITFLANGMYTIGGGGVADAAGQPGIEFGTYSCDPSTRVLTANVGAFNTDGDWGFSNPGIHGEPGTAIATVTFSGSTASFVAPDGRTTVLTRVYDPANAIVGSWANGTGTNTIVVTYRADGVYVMAGGGVKNSAGQPGVEVGTYTWDSQTGAFVANASSVDTNGCWGFSNPGPNCEAGPATATVTIADGAMTMDAMSWRRIGLQ